MSEQEMLGGRATAERRMSISPTLPIYEEEIFGDDMKEKNINIFRIISQNVNGLIKQEDYHRLKLELSTLEDTKYDALLIQESNINWNKRGTQRTVDRYLKEYQPIKQVNSHCPNYEKSEFYQQGGTTAFFRNNAAKLNETIEQDELGRWTINKIKIKDEELYIINIYRPQKYGNNGLKSVWHQQITHFRNKLQNITNPRQNFDNDLLIKIREINQRTNKIIMAGDLNEYITSTDNTNEQIETTGLYNVLKYRNVTKPPNTHITRTQAIDHIWVSEAILDSITAAGMLPFGAGITSGHRPLFLDISLSNFRTTENIRNPPRRLSTKHIEAKEKYIENLRTELQNNQIQEKLREIRQQIKKMKIST